MRRSIKRVLGSLAGSALLRPWARRVFRRHRNVVYYHYVGSSLPYYSAFYGGCTLDRFARDLEQLARVFRFCSLEELCNSEVDAGSPALAVTFDDGFKINSPELLALFDRHGIRVTTFVITSCLGNRRLMWRNMLSAVLELRPSGDIVREYNAIAAGADLPPISGPEQLMPASWKWEMARKDDLAADLWGACRMPPLVEFLAEHQPYFTEDELSAWQSAGHGIGLHTATHPDCSRLNEDDVVAEIIEPASWLRERFGLDFLPLSYPFGERLSPVVEQSLVERGVVDCAFGIEGFASAAAPPHRLERAGVEQFGVGWPVFVRSLARCVFDGRA